MANNNDKKQTKSFVDVPYPCGDDGEKRMMRKNRRWFADVSAVQLSTYNFYYCYKFSLTSCAANLPNRSERNWLWIIVIFTDG